MGNLYFYQLNNNDKVNSMVIEPRMFSKREVVTNNNEKRFVYLLALRKKIKEQNAFSNSHNT